MIDLQISGTLPSINPKLPMQLVAERLLKSIQMNFMVSGRPAWEALKGRQETPLVASGYMYHQVKSSYTVSTAEAGIDSPKPYMLAQQFGAVTHPQVTQKSKAFFWAMFYETGQEKWKWMALQPVGKIMNIRIAARPFVMFQDSDIEFIYKILTDAIISGPSQKISEN